MKKKLKLRIVKFDRLLVVEQIERTLLIPATAKHFQEIEDMSLYLGSCFIELPQGGGRMSDGRYFDSNAERDEYLRNMLGWISDELFGGAGKLEVGKTCEISDDGKTWRQRIYAGELVPELGKGFLVRHPLFDFEFFSAKYVRPLSAQPTIDGDIYTWEGE